MVGSFTVTFADVFELDPGVGGAQADAALISECYFVIHLSCN